MTDSRRVVQQQTNQSPTVFNKEPKLRKNSEGVHSNAVIPSFLFKKAKKPED